SVREVSGGQSGASHGDHSRTDGGSGGWSEVDVLRWSEKRLPPTAHREEPAIPLPMRLAIEKAPLQLRHVSWLGPRSTEPDVACVIIDNFDVSKIRLGQGPGNHWVDDDWVPEIDRRTLERIDK